MSHLFWQMYKNIIQKWRENQAGQIHLSKRNSILALVSNNCQFQKLIAPSPVQEHKGKKHIDSHS